MRLARSAAPAGAPARRDDVLMPAELQGDERDDFEADAGARRCAAAAARQFLPKRQSRIAAPNHALRRPLLTSADHCGARAAHRHLWLHRSLTYKAEEAGSSAA